MPDDPVRDLDGAREPGGQLRRVIAHLGRDLRRINGALSRSPRVLLSDRDLVTHRHPRRSDLDRAVGQENRTPPLDAHVRRPVRQEEETASVEVLVDGEPCGAVLEGKRVAAHDLNAVGAAVPARGVRVSGPDAVVVAGKDRFAEPEKVRQRHGRIDRKAP